jgi:hypothetical protein
MGEVTKGTFVLENHIVLSKYDFHTVHTLQVDGKKFLPHHFVLL